MAVGAVVQGRSWELGEAELERGVGNVRSLPWDPLSKSRSPAPVGPGKRVCEDQVGMRKAGPEG